MKRHPEGGQRILVVDDEENMRHMLQVMLRKQGYSVDGAPDGETALSMALVKSYDFVLCDIRMPGMDGLAFLGNAAESGICATIIMMSAYGSIDTAIECMKNGAYDYISKPFRQDEVMLVLKKAEERERLKAENLLLREEVRKEFSFAGLISRSGKMREIFSLVGKLCDLKTTVLVQGESGTGKELVARAIHYNGCRASAPFVAVNCGAIPENLLESELFGHVKGAYTDATEGKRGLFEQAHGGTLFLDEIGEMPLPLQVKLLRVLQEGEVRPLGSESSRRIDVRVISATARDLEQESANGRFREDLFFRLNVFTISLPPLRERVVDIPLLSRHFIEKFSPDRKVRCSPEVISILMEYEWPGNVRELENCIERSLILCGGDVIERSMLPEKLQHVLSAPAPDGSSGCLSIKRAEELMERSLIKRALTRTGGNRTHAAKLLEISHRALLYKLKEYGLE
ncbi:sigma-54 dependent transcriptional regulator [Geobacter sp. DSM 9736]|uniref:sigma-54-dependent transcriptional regulator n=1 Tax=Geobacter sp. DSM 9736 TaxID=1277350 RepID=UPI000B50C45A|nr:sigma-54 dependent transcriptional regulator [Geobacter sp. DSM 9736]SNB46202.1 two-component system, NtrC family, response regulator AtoC [Geobacter sp. DSM 9736]